MKKKFIRAVCIFISGGFTVSAQQPEAVWYKNFGGTHHEYDGNDRSLCATADGGYVWVGSTGSGDGDVPANYSFPATSSVLCNAYYRDVYVVKFEADGDIQWSKNYGGDNIENGFAIRQTADGGYIVACSSSSDDQDVSDYIGYDDLWVLKLSPVGLIQWEVVYGGTENEYAYAVDVTSDGYIVAGRTQSLDGDVIGGDGSDAWLLKISNTGVLIWQKIFDVSGSTTTPVEFTSDGGYILGGTYNLAKLNVSGNVVWEINTGDYDSIIETPEGNYATVGSNQIRKYSSTGVNDWIIYYEPEPDIPGSDYTYRLTSIINSQFGGYLVSGYRSNTQTNVSNYDYSGFILHVTESGVVDWTSSTELIKDRFLSIIELEDGSIIAGGTVLGNLSQYSNSSYSYSHDGLVARFEKPTLGTSLYYPADIDICAGENITLTADVSSYFFPPYQFQLSDANSDFSNPVELGVSHDGIHTGVIPSNTPSGDGYRARAVSLYSGQIGEDNGVDITIHGFNTYHFAESIGSVAGSATIAAHEAANAFDQDGFTMSGTATVSNSNPSSGYDNASGGANIFLGNTGSNTFIISGINTIGLEGMYLQFGWIHSLISGMEVAVSTNGSSYTNLSLTSLGIGWSDDIATGIIPQTTNLFIRFTRTGILSGEVRIDDIRLTRDVANINVTANGPTAFCGPGSVELTAPSATSYLWNNGATSQAITISISGNFSCELVSAYGCDIETSPIHVQTTAGNYYLDEDGDGFGQPNTGQSMCAPDGTHTVFNSDDCNDSDPTIHKGAIELCDGIDNDCDDTIDELFDHDYDGYAGCAGDCNDYDPSINPGAQEVYNGIDDNCNGVTDEYTPNMYFRDLDGDTYGDAFNPHYANTLEDGYVTNYLDCDDYDAAVNPGAEEICSDGIDNNCDGIMLYCSNICLGDLDDNGAVNINDLLIFTSVFGNTCGIN